MYSHLSLLRIINSQNLRKILIAPENGALNNFEINSKLPEMNEGMIVKTLT